MNIQRTALPVIAALLIAACGGESSPDNRSEEDRARDAGRKPFEVVAFVGIEPGMNVLDVMAAVYSTLKPGGVFGVIDHQGLEGQDNAELHRMLKADAIRVAEAAGFTLEADSDILHSDIDDMTQHMRAEGIRGHTNRFLLRLRKPK